MGTNPVPCLQGKLALRLQETSAPEFVDLIFQTLKLVSGEQTGWQRGQAEAKERQRKEQEAGGSTRVEGAVGPALYSTCIFLPGYHSRQNPQQTRWAGNRVMDTKSLGGQTGSEETELRGSWTIPAPF